MVKVLSKFLTAPGGVFMAISELLIAAIGVVSVASGAQDRFLASCQI